MGPFYRFRLFVIESVILFQDRATCNSRNKVLADNDIEGGEPLFGIKHKCRRTQGYFLQV